MFIFPAIDLYDGKAVRLLKGDYDRMTVYSDNPQEIALEFEKQGAGFHASFLNIVDSDFEYKEGTFAKIALCTPPCDRTLRPLSCRIFPLFPYITVEGDLEIIMDPRANAMCPLARRLEPDDLDAKFVRRIENIFKVLVRFEEVETYLFELSRQIDF